MTSSAEPFLAVLLLLLLALVVGAGTVWLSGWLLPRLGLKPRRPRTEKTAPYECGAPLLQRDARQRYGVKFYMVAMLFILFDVEVAFLLPWAVIYRQHLWTFWPILGFLGTLLAGYYYVWQRGALEWER